MIHLDRFQSFHLCRGCSSCVACTLYANKLPKLLKAPLVLGLVCSTSSLQMRCPAAQAGYLGLLCVRASLSLSVGCVCVCGSCVWVVLVCAEGLTDGCSQCWRYTSLSTSHLRSCFTSLPPCCLSSGIPVICTLDCCTLLLVHCIACWCTNCRSSREGIGGWLCVVCMLCYGCDHSIMGSVMPCGGLIAQGMVSAHCCCA